MVVLFNEVERGPDYQDGALCQDFLVTEKVVSDSFADLSS